jgi:aryl-alcohol dehydrogenase-like predicted oxidoreductase
MVEPAKRVLGRTGFEISELGFGAWPIGGTSYGPLDEKEAHRTVDAYIDAGGNHIDTARVYGESEARIGVALKGKGLRDTLFIASKTQRSASAETIPEIRTDLEQSLRLLHTDYVDLYYLHWPPDDPDVMNRVLDEYETLKLEGKIRWIGASIKGPSVSEDTVRICKQYIDTGRVDAVQIVYSILRQRNSEIFEYAQEKGVGLVARTVLESGFLTGKYQPGSEFSAGHRSKYTNDTLKEILNQVGKLESNAIRSPYVSLPQVAIRFALEPSSVSSAIVGARTAEQMKQNMAVASLPALEDELVEWLKNEFKDATENYNPAATVAPSLAGKKID